MIYDLLEAYEAFILKAWPYIHIDNEKQYNDTLKFMEHILELSEDLENDRYNFLIDLVSKAIEKYESSDQKIVRFMAEADN